MKYLLDTNILSEFSNDQPAQCVIDFVRSVGDNFYCSSLSLGEMVYGIRRLPESKRKIILSAWFESELSEIIKDKILGFDGRAAEAWGRMRADCESKGIVLQMADSMIAAIALSNGLAIATRNTKDFGGIEGLELVNPWKL
jgi:predicted nucleic acid-binding protein